MEALASLFSAGTQQQIFETLYQKQSPYRVVDIAGVSEESANAFFHTTREGASAMRWLHPISSLNWMAEKKAVTEAICIHLSEDDAMTLRQFVDMMPRILAADAMSVDAEELIALSVLHDEYCDDVWTWARDAFQGSFTIPHEDDLAIDEDTYFTIVLNLLEAFYLP